MSIDENLDWLYRLRSEIYVYMPVAWIVPMNNAVDMAIKALKQYGALQEIRQEIESLTIARVDDNYVRNMAGLYCVKREIIEIIDKHIKEIEGSDRIITAQLYDDEHEEFIEEKMSIIDNINAYTNEGVTEADIVEQTRWIPVSERYPQIEDEYKYFLVTDDEGEVSVQEFFISLDEEPQPYFSGMVNVIAWMPFPKPFKTESEE